MPRKELLRRVRTASGTPRAPGRARLSHARDPAKTRTMGSMTVLIAALVTAFAVYGMIAGDHQLLSDVWTFVKGAAIALIAWAGGGALRRS